MPSISVTDRIADGWRRSADAVWLAFVPVVLSLFSVDKLLRVVRMDGFHVGVNFLSFPSPSSNVWQFVSVPQSGDLSIGLGPSLGVVVLGFVVSTALLGGYLGSVRRLLDDDAEGVAFVRDSLAYLGPVAVWTGIPSLVSAGTAVVAGGFGSVSPSSGNLLLALGLFVAYVVLGYLLYAAPFLVVLRDTGIADAVRSSYEFALEGGPYASYAIGYVLFVLVVSVPTSLVVVNLGVVGLLVGVPLGGRLGLAATTATMRFVADIDDRSPTLREWNEDGDGWSADASDDPHETGTDRFETGAGRFEGGTDRFDGGDDSGDDRFGAGGSDDGDRFGAERSDDGDRW